MLSVDYTDRTGKVYVTVKGGQEIWKDVVGYEGRYQVSDQGHVKTLTRKVYRSDGRLHYVQREKILAGSPSGNGYPMVNLGSGSGKSAMKYVHELILQAFVGSRETGMECRHLDGNRLNNWLGNLKWGTSKEQADDRRRHGTNVGNRGRTRGMHYNCGEDAAKAKFTESDVREIRRVFAEGNHTFVSLSKVYGVHPTTINAIVKRKHWSYVI